MDDLSLETPEKEEQMGEILVYQADNGKTKLDEFLRFNERRVLPSAGQVSKQAAEDHAKTEYSKFEVRRRKYKESLGEAETIKQLEEAAKMLGNSMPKVGKRRK